MIKDIIERMADDIGFDIGNSDDVTQAKLLNGFCRGLFNSMDDRRLESQICYITEKLEPKTKKIMKDIVGFIELDEREVKN